MDTLSLHQLKKSNHFCTNYHLKYLRETLFLGWFSVLGFQIVTLWQSFKLLIVNLAWKHEISDLFSVYPFDKLSGAFFHSQKQHMRIFNKVYKSSQICRIRYVNMESFRQKRKKEFTRFGDNDCRGQHEQIAFVNPNNYWSIF